MPYFTVTDFAAGLDLRRTSLTAPAGTLRKLKNAHVTPGGEIEKRFAFVKFADADPASKGLAALGGHLYTFMPGLTPARVVGTVHNLKLDDHLAIAIDNTFTVSDGTTTSVLTYKAGTTVENFLNVVNNNVDLQIRAKFIVYGYDPNDFKDVGGLVFETRSNTDLIIGGSMTPAEFALLGINTGLTSKDPVSYPPPTGTWEIGKQKLEVNPLNGILDYDLFDNQIYVIADDGTPVAKHCFNGVGVAEAAGRYCRTHKTKMHAVEGPVLYFSAIGDAGDWTGTGSGLTDLGLEDADMTECLALEVYYDKLAIFSMTACQLWTIDQDPLLSQYNQTLRQAGTFATQSVLQYGSGDVLFAAHDGIRSLRARNSSLAASVSDVGSPLDPIMQQLFREKGEEWVGRTISILQPVTGRFWVIMPDRIYILSAFPGPKITAWSEYTPTDPDGHTFVITHAVVHEHHIVVRDENNHIYSFGGTSHLGVTYDKTKVEIEFPFLAADKPAHKKKFHGIDAVAQGEWDVYVCFDPDSHDPDDPTKVAEDYVGKLVGSTFQQGRYPIEGDGTHISLRLRSPDNWDGPLVLSSLTIHYDLAEAG